jgi:uncharacterized paraquat-inducible protein A
MKKLILLTLLLSLMLVVTACVNRMAPFAPHRSNTEDHRAVSNNQDCIGCHEVADLGKGHQASEDCLRCHRIVQGD